MYPETPRMTTLMMNRRSDTADSAACLAEYAALLLGCGATCIRTEKNTRRMAGALGYGVDMCIMPSQVEVGVW